MAHHRDLPYSKLMIIVDFSKISITVFFLHISLKLLCIIIQNRKKKNFLACVVSKEFLEGWSIFNFFKFSNTCNVSLFYETCIGNYIIFNLEFQQYLYINITIKID